MREMIHNNALSALIKKSITEDIILGKIQPGEKLVEAKYAEEFGTSRAPIREAFYLLTLEGFAQKIPRKGTVVKGYSPEEIKDLLELRCFLENQAIDKLRNRDMSEYLAKMNTIITHMKELPKGEYYTQLNYEFHFQLILASGSDVIKNMYSRLGTPLLSVQTMAFLEEVDIKKSVMEHQQIVAYLENKEIDYAKELLDNHNKAVFPRIEKYVKKTAEGGETKVEYGSVSAG